MNLHRSVFVRHAIQLATLIVLVVFALPAEATCTVEPGTVVGSFLNIANTNSATIGTADANLGTFPAGTTVIVGTAGLSGSTTTTDTFLRLFDQNGEVAFNDDACDGLGSRVVFTVPQGWRTLTVHAGCSGNTTCSGTVAIWTRLDSNGYLSEPVLHGYNQIVTNDFTRIQTTNVHNDAPISASYKWCGIFGGECFSHFQGIQRLYRPSVPDNAAWFVMSGSNTGDLMFGYPGGGGANARDKTWKENGSIYNGSITYTRPFGTLMQPFGRYGNHLGGIQQTGNYVIGGLQKYDDTEEYQFGGLIMLFDVSLPPPLPTMANPYPSKKWEMATAAGSAPTDVAITKHRDGTILLAVGRYNEHSLDFYQKNADEYTTALTTPLSYPLNANPMTAGKVGFADIEDPTGWNYMSTMTQAQNTVPVPPFNNINLFTQLNGGMYLMGSRVTNGLNSTFYGWLDGVNRTVDSWPAERAGFVCNLSLPLTGYCDFLAASGFYADALSNRMYLYSADKYLEYHAPSGYAGISEFGTTLAPLAPNLYAPSLQHVDGLLQTISVGPDGSVCGVNSDGFIYCYDSQGLQWRNLPGSLTQIVVGGNGQVWGLNPAGDIFRFDPSSQNWNWIPGNLTQIAVGADGDVWGLNSANQVYHFDANAQNWIGIVGNLATIAVGFDGAVWGLDGAGNIFRFNVGNQAFEQLPGYLSQIAVGADGDVWGVNAANQVWRFDSLVQNWESIPGELSQISVGSATNVWGLDAAHNVFHFDTQTQNWIQIPGTLTHISAGQNGALWGLDGFDKIYQFNGPTQQTQTFHSIPGSLKQIAAGPDGNAWGINSDQLIYHFNARIQNWENVPGLLTQISVGFGGVVWGINSDGYIYRFDSTGQSWITIPGSLSQITVGANGSVWGINSAGQIYRYNAALQNWDRIPGLLTQLSVGADGEVWGIDAADQIWRFNSHAQIWDFVPGSLTQIAVGSGNAVWGLNSAGQIWKFNAQAQNWDAIPGVLAEIAVGFDGTVWGVNSSKFVYRFNTQAQNWDQIPGLLNHVTASADVVIWGIDINSFFPLYRYW